MAFETTSPNMNLVLPGVGLTFGPQWATDLNASLTIVDQHNHTSGSGVAIPSTGLNINADLPMGSNNLTGIRTLRMNSQSGVLSVGTDLDCLYVVGADLYYNDGIGNHVRMTQSGAVSGTPGSISNLVSPASAAYVAGSKTFVWQSDANTPANLDAASITLRNIVANSKGLTLNPPNSMAADYSIVLPSLPTPTSFMTIDNSGNISTVSATSGITGAMIATATITDSNMVPATITAASIANATITAAKVVSGTLTTAQIASATIVGGNIAANTIVNNNLAQHNYTVSSGINFSTGSASFVIVTNSSITITLAGSRFVKCSFIAQAGNSGVFCDADASMTVKFVNATSSTLLGQFDFTVKASSKVFPGMTAIQAAPNAGGNTYRIEMSTTTGTATIQGLFLVEEF